jgi:uroporphyrinogen decarboxylase
MNCLERCLCAVRRQVPDRVPVVPLIISHAVRQAGIAFSEYNQSPELIASVQAQAWRRYGYDGIHVTTDNWILPQALGVPVRFHDDMPPVGLTRPLAAARDLSLLPPLEEAKSAARMGLLPAATRCARGMLGDSCFIKTNFDQGPFSLASAVRGIEALMMDTVDQEQFVFDLLEMAVEMVSHLGIEVGRAGAHAVTFGDAVAGLVSREDFIKFAFPALQEVVRRLHAQLDVPVFLHICGKTTHIVDYMAKTGADALELDFQNDFGEMKRAVGSQVCLEGNVDPSGVLLQGTPELVYRKSRELIQSAGPGGFILSSGCEVPRDTPPENVEAMVRASRDGGLS